VTPSGIHIPEQRLKALLPNPRLDDKQWTDFITAGNFYWTLRVSRLRREFEIKKFFNYL
jgi:hypothetical protein